MSDRSARGVTWLSGVLVALCFGASALAQTRPGESGHSSVLPSRSSPPSMESSHRDVLGDDRSLESGLGSLPVRSIDGSGNNRDRPDWGRAGSTLLRLTTLGYDDGIDAPAMLSRSSAREISNLCAAQTRSIPSPSGVSSFVWQWGQFLDHDIDLVPVKEPREAVEIEVPAGDRYFDPERTGRVRIPFERSLYRKVNGVRQQVNAVTAFIDGSNVYGSDVDRALALRTMDGTGRLRTSSGDLLPFNRRGLENSPTELDRSLFLAGDVRANEQVGLSAMHTLFVREHNYWARLFHEEDLSLSGDEIYERSRMIVAAELQAITYREFLPVLLGADALGPFGGYDPSVNPGIANVFATAAYRFGHSMLPSRLLRLDREGVEIAAGHLSLAESFFNPAPIRSDGIEPLLRGLARQPAQRVDTTIVHEVRNFLFAGPRAGGFDLAALNIQRGRDHGLPSYNRVRLDFGWPAARTFAEVNPDPNVQQRLSEAYAGVDDIDAWLGGLSEPVAPGALVGETWLRVLSDQFRRFRAGDRFWYQRYLPPELVTLVEAQTLATIIRRNSSIDDEIGDDVFRVP